MTNPEFSREATRLLIANPPNIKRNIEITQALIERRSLPATTHHHRKNLIERLLPSGCSIIETETDPTRDITIEDTMSDIDPQDQEALSEAAKLFEQSESPADPDHFDIELDDNKTSIAGIEQCCAVCKGIIECTCNDAPNFPKSSYWIPFKYPYVRAGASTQTTTIPADTDDQRRNTSICHPGTSSHDQDQDTPPTPTTDDDRRPPAESTNGNEQSPTPPTDPDPDVDTQDPTVTNITPTTIKNMSPVANAHMMWVIESMKDLKNDLRVVYNTQLDTQKKVDAIEDSLNELREELEARSAKFAQATDGLIASTKRLVNLSNEVEVVMTKFEKVIGDLKAATSPKAPVTVQSPAPQPDKIDLLYDKYHKELHLSYVTRDIFKGIYHATNIQELVSLLVNMTGVSQIPSTVTDLFTELRNRKQALQQLELFLMSSTTKTKSATQSQTQRSGVTRILNIFDDL